MHFVLMVFCPGFVMTLALAPLCLFGGQSCIISKQPWSGSHDLYGVCLVLAQLLCQLPNVDLLWLNYWQQGISSCSWSETPMHEEWRGFIQRRRDPRCPPPDGPGSQRPLS